LKGNIWLGNSSTGIYLGGNGSGASSASHFVFENNVLEPPTIRVEVDGSGNPVTTTDTVFSSVKNCVFGAVFTAQTFNAGWTHDWPWINCCFMYGNGYGSPSINTGSNSGNFSYANPGGNQTTNFQALFVNYAAGDLRPANGGLLLANLKAKVNLAANDNTAFAATDVVGALSSNSPAPKYPF
ncbi:MAG: hypothetical protein JSR98_18050, partial [Proteobacteria bacterium]|nr:hypothetical protein [Pseudomonadota bacterium]